MTQRIIVTGGQGFIGSNLVRFLVKEKNLQVLNLDSLSYAAHPESLKDIAEDPNYFFLKRSICDKETVLKSFFDFKPDAIMHLAAESHVDRSITGPKAFIDTNILGTFNLLEAAKTYFNELPQNKKQDFRFLHISTDEVFGSLGKSGSFCEKTAYKPNSPYSASKAASDHLVRAWYKTYELPTLISNCSNNFGPYQFPEKLIPLMIISAIKGQKLPIYGNGSNIRDWLFVKDHIKALYLILTKGRCGESYNVGGGCEMSNLDLVRKICDILQELRPQKNKYSDLISFVEDRAGHDFRYSVNPEKIKKELQWQGCQDFDASLKESVSWYLDNQKWWESILDKSYQKKPKTPNLRENLL